MERGYRPIPNRLKMHRKLMRYKQRHIATLLGLPNVISVSKWEKGIAMPSINNLIKLSLVYRTLPHELYPELFSSLREELNVKEMELFKKV